MRRPVGISVDGFAKQQQFGFELVCSEGVRDHAQRKHHVFLLATGSFDCDLARAGYRALRLDAALIVRDIETAVSLIRAALEP